MTRRRLSKPGVAKALQSVKRRANKKPHAATLVFMGECYAILETHHPMTVRQVFYRLVSNQTIENTKQAYNKVMRVLGDARLQGRIPWEWIEDRLREPTIWQMYNGTEDFLSSMARWYMRDIWGNQPCYIEVIVEKDALSGIFSNILYDYRVTLNVARGYNSQSAVKDMAGRFGGSKPVHVLHFGDFDPEGENAPETIEAALRHHCPYLDLHFRKCALLPEDIEQYDLPENFTKVKGTRRKKFVAKHGDRAVELDALPVEVLEQRIRSEIEALLDMKALEATKYLESREREQLRTLKLPPYRR